MLGIKRLSPATSTATTNGNPSISFLYLARTISKSSRLISSSSPVGWVSGRLEGSVMWSLALMNEWIRLIGPKAAGLLSRASSLLQVGARAPLLLLSRASSLLQVGARAPLLHSPCYRWSGRGG